MSAIVDQVLAANQKYSASFGEKANLALPPARHFAVLTCMDARLDPAKYAGLAEGDAHVIRNAGGRASDDAIRSLVISYKLLGTREFFVIHHTDCGMEFFTNEVMRGLLSSSLETAALTAARLSRRGQRAGLAGRRVHRVAHHRRSEASRSRRCDADSQSSARSPFHSDLRLCLRREDRKTDRSRSGHPGRKSRLKVPS